jgi:tripartite-type tricarboxylate transporter receptor subunit TctC
VMWEKSKDSIWRHRRAAGPLSALALVSVLAIAAHDIKPASAQDWPTRSLTMVVPFAAGGGTDVMARIVGRRMSEILGQEVSVQNKPGAGGMVGSAYVARARPDGYTFVFGSRSAAIDMTLYKHPTYSLQNDLAPVVLVADQPTILVARKDLPVDRLQDFIAYVKRNASTIRMGSAGVGATGFVDCAIFNGMIGVNIQAIPYRGSGPAMQDLITRQFDYMCTISGSAAAPLQNDLIKGIAVLRHERLPSLPNVPTAYEQGMDFNASTWFGFFVPKGTPAAIIKKLHDVTVAAMETPWVQEQLATIGAYVVPPEHRSTEYFESIIGPEIEKNGAPLKALGISVD